jgi:hypothetical protein
MLQSIYGPTDTKLIAGQMAALYIFAISNLSTTLSRQRLGNSLGLLPMPPYEEPRRPRRLFSEMGH